MIAAAENITQNGLIQLTDIVKVFKTHAGETTVLKKVNLSFAPSEFVCIVGKSGSGKSTLVNMITGIDHPTSGLVQVNGTNLHKMKEGALAVWRGRNMGVVFQFFQLLPMLTVLENTLLPMDFLNHTAFPDREERARELLKLVGLEPYSDKLPAALSGGQQQTAAVARALANDPPIIVADEPTGNLDSVTAETVFQIFVHMIERGKTIIMVTHDKNLAQRANRQIIISDGEIVDEDISLSMPFLTHPQMLQLTHLAQTRTLHAGEMLMPVEDNQTGLIVIKSGRVEISNTKKKDGAVSDFLSPNEYFSLFEKGECPTVFLKADSSMDLKHLYISRSDFEQWLAKNDQVKDKFLARSHERCSSQQTKFITSWMRRKP